MSRSILLSYRLMPRSNRGIDEARGTQASCEPRSQNRDLGHPITVLGFVCLIDTL
jgi:hypothetical protein